MKVCFVLQSVEAGCTNVLNSYAVESLCEAIQELTWLTSSETTRQAQAQLAFLLDALRLPAIPSPSPSCTTLEKHAREKTEKVLSTRGTPDIFSYLKKL